MITNNSSSICSRCVKNTILRGEIRKKGVKSECAFCRSAGLATVTVSALAERIEPVFKAHYSPINSHLHGGEWLSDLDEYECFYDYDSQSPQEIIGDIAGISESAAKIVSSILAKRQPSLKPGDVDDRTNLFDSDTRLEERYSAQFAQNWDKMERDLHHRSRFFNKELLEFVADLFKDIHKRRGTNHLIHENWIKPVYRARVAHGKNELIKILSEAPTQLGAPVGRIGKKPGRMNAAGISVFYGSFDKKTCLAEIRAAVGSDVVLGKFEFIRPVTLLNLENLKKNFKMDIFDPAYEETAKKSHFLGQLSAKFSTPVQPNEEIFDYLLTQFVCEYLSEMVTPKLDGVIFRSTQNKKGKNVALFQRALDVESWDVQPGATYDIRFDDDDYEDEDNEDAIVLCRTLKKLSNEEIDNFNHSGDEKGHQPTLRLSHTAITVERVVAIAYQSTSSKLKISEYDPNSNHEF